MLDEAPLPLLSAGMRFIDEGPSIPDELLVARDAGDVIFFCGAGVSQAKAGLPNFDSLARDVIRMLGAAQDSPARKLLEKALETGRMASVGGLLATDRVFGLLEREFEVADIRSAVAEAIQPKADHGLLAHRILLDLATSRAGVTRLVTTNFDLLFEECDPLLLSSGPPNLPDPRSDRDFRGVVHLHGRVDALYRQAKDDEFVISSADFGRAYLSDGWATRFIQSLLARFQIVFVGYTADDPPVQYLLEALNLRAGTRKRLFAFQDGESSSAAALWEHKGVQAIPFDASNRYAALWDTLGAWADRARDIDGWYARLLSTASKGPAELDPHVRGQIAHVISTRDGAHRIATAEEPLAADWLLALDPDQRYRNPGRMNPYGEEPKNFDPFGALGLDSDTPPEPIVPDNRFAKRKVPCDALDLFALNRLDIEDVGEKSAGVFRGQAARSSADLPHRLLHIGIWIQRVAHQPTTLWWAAQQASLHPAIIRLIKISLQQDPLRFPDAIRHGWRLLISAWDDVRDDPDVQRYEIQARANREGCTESLIRDLAGVYRPRLKVEQSFGISHPLLWSGGPPESVIKIEIEYPSPHGDVDIPEAFLAYAISQFRGNLELAKSLEQETSGNDRLYFHNSRADDGAPDLSENEYGLTGPIIHLQKLMRQLAKIDPAAFLDEVRRWPLRDDYVFARLRIWAAGSQLLNPSDAAAIFLSLSDVAFWGVHHERDLLYALRDHWPRSPKDARIALEHRLLMGFYPWEEDVRGGRERLMAYHRLDRLHWLSHHGVEFSFDLAAEMNALLAIAPDWTTKAGDVAADSHAPMVHSVETDTSPDSILNVPISEILSQAQDDEQFDIGGRVQRRPFKGLVDRKPVRALAALTHVGRNGEAPPWAWSAFLYSDNRQTDPVRRIGVIAGRLARLPLFRIQEIAYPVSDWMDRVAPRLYGDAKCALGSLWDSIIATLALGDDERERRTNRSWADDALNAPVGKLVNLLMKDPAKDGFAASAGNPPHWTTRLNQLLGLPGDFRQHALVLISYQLPWLFTIDPLWTEQWLLSCAEDTGNDGDAFWDGVLWQAKAPSLELFLRLKPGLIARIYQTHFRRRHTNVFAALMLGGWGGYKDTEQVERLITDVELREALIHTDDQFRSQIIWHLGKWASDKQGRWREQVIPFIKDVWPKQRALRSPTLSAKLVDFALASGELMPAIVDLILPRLVPIRGPSLYMLQLNSGSDDHPIQRYPRATLDLLWAILADDPALWPYKIEDVLEKLGQVPETSGDSRLSELRRRQQRQFA